MTEAQAIDSRETINVEDYPWINPATDEGKEELGAIAFRLAHGRTPIHFVFRQGGEEIGEMIIKMPFVDRVQ